MELSLFSEISLVIAIAMFIGLIMHLLRQPLIISHILTGIVIGPSILGLVSSEDTIKVFANFGIALLLFVIGLGLNPTVIRELGRVSAITGLTQIGISALIGYGVASLLGFGSTTSWLIGLAMSFSSTIIILKLLSDKKEQTRLYGKLAIGLLLVQDVIASIALIGVSALGQDGEFSSSELLELSLKGLLVGIGLYLFSAKILPHISKVIANSQEFLFLFALGWGLGISSLFELSGFSIEVGALFAGVSLAPLPYSQEMSARLRPLRDFFIVLFFIELGSQIDIFHISSIIWQAIVLSIMVVIIKPILVMFILGMLGYTKNTSFKTGLAMAQISEFSIVLILVARDHGQLGDEIISLITMVALISIAASTYMIMYTNGLYKLLESRLRLFERKKIEYEQESANRYEIVLFGYKKGGAEFMKIFHSMKKHFVVIDYDPEVIDHLEHRKYNFIYGDATDLELLEEAGVQHAKLVISTITDHATNKILVPQILKMNKNTVLICQSDTAKDAAELYSLGATYVMMPHYIGSEKIGNFIRRNGFVKAEFKKFRDKHLSDLESNYELYN